MVGRAGGTEYAGGRPMSAEDLDRLERLTSGRRSDAHRRPPPLHSLARLQRLLGNRGAQQVLRIGDGRAAPTSSGRAGPAAAAAASISSSRWSRCAVLLARAQRGLARLISRG